MLFIRRLLDFSKPKFLNLDYIDIVLEEKTLLLISWKFKRHYKVKISSLNKTYRSYETAIVIKMPVETNQSTITIYSFWRKQKYRILFKKIRLNKETAQFLITKFKPVETLLIKTPIITSVCTFRDTKLPMITLKEKNLNTKIPFISVTSDKLTYTNKTNHYE